MASSFRFAIDRGGTFTDIFCEYLDSESQLQHRVLKLLSEDPQNYKDAPTEGIRRILEEATAESFPKDLPINASKIEWIRMGTTVATNALLERKGENIALLITEGFKDLLLIGNQSRPHIFALNIQRSPKLFQEVIEVQERVKLTTNSTNSIRGITGESFEVTKPLNKEKLREDLQRLLSKNITSIAVALAHSYSFTEHETQVKQLAQELGFKHISLSSEIMPMTKLVPRASTATVDAYLTPKIQEYISGFCSGFDENLANVKVLFMQSDGGLAPVGEFIGSRAILSGPAGGVIGFSQTSPSPVIGFDMGGTSTDVSRYAGNLEHLFETQISGIDLLSPHLDISTVAAGGGSRLFFRSGLYVVGPESAGAHPGPLCYKKNGYLTITDANLVLGRLLPEHFPKIFGPNEDEPLDYAESYLGMEKLTQEINSFQGASLTPEQVALGFIKVANESMCRPIRAKTSGRGYNPSKHTLSCFGGAGGQHACSIARNLGIQKVVVHKYSGILSAYGLGLADVVAEEQHPVVSKLTPEVKAKASELVAVVENRLKAQGFESIEIQEYLHMRFSGTDTVIPVPFGEDPHRSFKETYQQEYGFCLTGRDIIVDDLRVRGLGKAKQVQEPQISERPPASPLGFACTWFETEEGCEKLETPVYLLEHLAPHQEIKGPAIILNQISTVLVEPNCTAVNTIFGNLEIKVEATSSQVSKELDLIQLSLFSHRFMSIAEQMGKTLQRISISTNIKERLDFSCAIFSPDGSLVANAPHLPVHLGAMGEAVKAQIRLLGDSWEEGEVVVSNHPSAGGSHLPDITVITPVYSKNNIEFYVASRGHHADIGGISPGSMPPFSRFLSEEGIAVKSFKLVKQGEFDEAGLRQLFRESRCIEDNVSDLKAQIAANNKGIGLLKELIQEYGLEVVQSYMKYIQEAAEQSVKDMLEKISSEAVTLEAEDCMDDGTPIHLKIDIRENHTAHFDFQGTGYQVLSNLNTPEAVVKSAVIYCLRCLVDTEIPLNQGCLDPISISIPKGSILSPSETAAIVGGNVLTSQRVTDVIFKAFGAVAASQGCMNNFTFGNENFGFYETIAGGAGAGKDFHGESGVQTHMTNTRITDVEVMERRYPVVVREFSLRKGSGGKGLFCGGDGVVRDIEFLEEMDVGILSERRAFSPYGLKGGEPGMPGLNLWVRDNTFVNMGAKNVCRVSKGDRVIICTPGGGGYGKA